MSTIPRIKLCPLYLQARDVFVERIKSGNWKPGALIPNEVELSRELAVSIGTVRKALEVLEREHLITRQQGRGTFVRDPRTDAGKGRFNPICGPDGTPVSTQSRLVEVKLDSPTNDERAALRLQDCEQIIRVDRVKLHRNRPIAFERVCLPVQRFAPLSQAKDLPDDVEQVAVQHGVLLGHAKGRLTAQPACAVVSTALRLPAAAPVLVYERLVFDTDDHPVEQMVAFYALEDEYCRLDSV